MRDGIFTEELPVQLTEDEQDIRGRQSTRLLAALRAHQARAKEAKKKLADEERRLTEAVDACAEASRLGVEKRQVECFEILRGTMVDVIRRDTSESVYERPATKDEMKGAPEPLFPGGGSRRSDEPS